LDKMMAEHLYGTCKIEKLTTQGVGKGTSEHGSIFVPFVLPGEQIDYERFMKHPNSKREQPKFFLKNIQTTSLNRVDPVCAHFTQCGGCLLQHLNDKLYSAFKRSLIVEPFIDHQLDASCIQEVIVLPAGERRRANFEVVKKNDQVFLGFHRWRSHQIINLHECHTVDPKIAALFEPLRQLFLQIMIEYQKATVYLTVTAVGVDVSMDIHRDALQPNSLELLESFAKDNGLVRLIVRENRKRITVYEREKPYVLFDGVKVDVEPSSFLQASDRADQVLTELVMLALPEKAHKIVDLFCGRGTFTFPLSNKAPVDGFECDVPALLALQTAADREQRQIKTFKRNLFDDPLSAVELKAYDVAVIDPPRAGALAQVEQLAQSKVPLIAYISCGPESFARDAKILIEEGGYELEKVIPVDQFTWSPHLEVVGLFQKKV
jgi:23S rRNA (uracil1939-C5)-methyltransferase